jgi:hypothetical protein
VFADFDLDGDQDLFVANGHIYPQADWSPDTGTLYAQTNQVLEHSEGKFIDVSEGAGTGMMVRRSSRGVAAGDIDDDGDVDLVVANMDAPPTILRNDSERQGGWLIVDAPGAMVVEVTAGENSWRRQRALGGSYASASDPRFHFGLGNVSQNVRIRVTWADGTETVREDVAPNTILALEPGAPRP